jgi:hypothetical protein
MVKLETTLLDDIENSFAQISDKIESYRVKLDSSLSHFETDNHVENLIKSQRLLKRLSSDIDKSIDNLIEKYY